MALKSKVEDCEITAVGQLIVGDDRSYVEVKIDDGSEALIPIEDVNAARRFGASLGSKVTLTIEVQDGE